jgi:hypothetical protein
MRHFTTVLATFLFIACSTPDKENNAVIKDTILTTGQIPTAASSTDTNWVTYTDTINIGFVVSFKYPKRLHAEHFENAECIGKKIKMVDDGPMTTMDCCMWMDDITEGNIKPIDTLIQYDLQKLKTNPEVSKDTIDVANTKAIRVRYFDKKDKIKILRQSIYLTKYDTFFEINNDRLPTSEFETFIQSLKIDK